MISLILPFLQKYWMQIAVVSLGAIIFSFGWYQGYSYEKVQLDALKAQIATNAKIQEERNKFLVQSQEKITQDVTKGYSDAIKKLKEHYARTSTLSSRMPNNSTGSAMPQVSNSSSTINGEAESSLSSTLRDCALDVTQLLYLQKWIKDTQLIQGE